MLRGMSRLRTTIIVDEANLTTACELLGVTSRSEAVDIVARQVDGTCWGVCRQGDGTGVSPGS